MTSTSTPAVEPHRCQHRTPSGRRCKSPILRAGDRLCYNHTVEFKKADAFNLQAALLTDSQGFQTAQGINNALQRLYSLLANNYISPRRASVLAYISSLLLRTLPAIDADQVAGITDPTAPEAVAEPAPDKASAPAAASAAPNAPPAPQGVTPAWDPSNPEPDRNKKPS